MIAEEADDTALQSLTSADHQPKVVMVYFGKPKCSLGHLLHAIATVEGRINNYAIETCTQSRGQLFWLCEVVGDEIGLEDGKPLVEFQETDTWLVRISVVVREKVLDSDEHTRRRNNRNICIRPCAFQ